MVEEDSSSDANKCRVDFTFQVEFRLPILPEPHLMRKYLDNDEQPEHNQWYYNGTTVKVAGDVYKNFAEFFNLNKDNEQTCFIVALKPTKSDQLPEIKIIGEKALIISENFTTPVKLSFPRKVLVTYDSINFTVIHQGDEIMNHIQVTYGDVAMLVEVDPSGRTKISLNNLERKRNYEIRLQLISIMSGLEWAAGPVSDILTVTTTSFSPPSSLTATFSDTVVDLAWAVPSTRTTSHHFQYRSGNLLKINCF